MKNGYIVADKPMPFPFRKRKDGKYYAKASLDTIKIAEQHGIEDSDLSALLEGFKRQYKTFKETCKPNYQGRHKLYTQQRVAHSLITNNKSVALFMEQGTGKTLSVLSAMETLYKPGMKILVLTLIAVIDEWIYQARDFGIEVPVHNYRKTKEPKAGINVINFESAWRRDYKDWDIIVIDESQKIKNSGTKVSKWVCDCNPDRRVIMTGTSGIKPEEYFGQYKFLESLLFGENAYNFKVFFTYFDEETGQVYGLKANKKDKFWSRVHSLSYWVKKEECLDLPQQIMEYQYVEVPAKVRKAMKELDKDQISTALGFEVVAPHALVSKTLEHQLAQGHLKNHGHIHDAKIKALKDMDISEPVVIFTVFKNDVQALKKIFPKAAIVDGDHRETDLFKSGKTDVLIANYASGSTGLNLQRASLIIFYGLTWSYQDYSQAMSRIHRIGQTRKCVYVHLVAKGTIDEQIIKSLKKKEDFVVGGQTHERKLSPE